MENEKELHSPGYVIQFGIPPNRIDLMNSIDGVSFEEAWNNKMIENIVVKDIIITVYFLGLKDLIQNKKSSGRQKDLDDLSYLKRL